MEQIKNDEVPDELANDESRRYLVTLFKDEEVRRVVSGEGLGVELDEASLRLLIEGQRRRRSLTPEACFRSRAGTTVGMTEPPRVPPDPDDETIIVPPTEETVVADEWEPESEVFVEQTVTEPPRRRLPVIWPWLLALLVLVLAGLGAAYFLTRDDDNDATTTASTTTAPTTETAVVAVSVPDVVGTTSSEATKTLGDAGFEVNVVAVPSDQPSGQVVAQSPSAGSEADKGSTVRLNVAQKAAATTATETTATETSIQRRRPHRNRQRSPTSSAKSSLTPHAPSTTRV